MSVTLFTLFLDDPKPVLDRLAQHGAGHVVRGSLLYSLVRDGRYVHVAMGTLVDAPTIKPSMHIFVGSKAPWFDITDDLPQCDGLPGS